MWPRRQGALYRLGYVEEHRCEIDSPSSHMAGNCRGRGDLRGGDGMTTKAPSKQASLEGQAILAYPDADIRCRRIWKGGQYVAVAPLGHLQPAGSTIALCGIETGCGNYATEDALRLCRNCVEKAARPAQGKSEIRAENNALRERNRALVGALQAITSMDTPCFEDGHCRAMRG